MTRIALNGLGRIGKLALRDLIDTNVTAVSRDPDARLVFGTAVGATWHQIDDRPTFDVKSDTKVSISAAAFGSYFAKFEHGAPIRVRRDR